MEFLKETAQKFLLVVVLLLLVLGSCAIDYWTYSMEETFYEWVWELFFG